ncbi:MAG TPA: 3-dehydroquinate synthase [Puia sp.]|nr:3-dehydroquinate synthase [Puia sp.]
MQKKTYQFSSKKVSYYFDADFSYLEKILDKDHAIIVTDENLFSCQQKKFKGWKTIVIRPGEKFKIQSTVDEIIHQLIQLEADRKSFLIGVGGGVVTDITGYVASVFMRGIPFGFVPTSVLAMVDASVGGKNGIDVGLYKNLVGVIRQPEFLLYDISFLQSLPEDEWVNGFAEVIKHAGIRDAIMFKELEKNSPAFYKKNKPALSKLIKRNVMIKSEIVQKDEWEKGDRRLLNFGHTIGHAIENVYALSHGKAISIGMVVASMISEQLTDFKDTARIEKLLDKYGLPTSLSFDTKKIFGILKMDKKRTRDHIHYVLLNKIGNSEVKPVKINELEKLVSSIVSAR